MSNRKNSKILLGSGVLLAFTSSLCCVAPLLTILAGMGSAISAFSWVAPLRPYLLGATVMVLGWAFHQVYKPQQKDACGCEGEERGSLLQSKTFVWAIAIISVLLLAFPHYAGYFQRKFPQQQIVGSKPINVQETVLHIDGMNCEACEGHVNGALLAKKGVKNVNTSYTKGETIVKFDSTVISLQQLVATIEDETGYKIIR
jgi:copper chaperone CopZ